MVGADPLEGTTSDRWRTGGKRGPIECRRYVDAFVPFSLLNLETATPRHQTIFTGSNGPRGSTLCRRYGICHEGKVDVFILCCTDMGIYSHYIHLCSTVVQYEDTLATPVQEKFQSSVGSATKSPTNPREGGETRPAFKAGLRREDSIRREF